MTYAPKWNVEQIHGKLRVAESSLEKARKTYRKACERHQEADSPPEAYDRMVQAMDRMQDAQEALEEIFAESRRMADWYREKSRQARQDADEKQAALKKALATAERLDQEYHRLLVMA